MAVTPRIFNIPASAPFLVVLIDALRTGKLVPGFPSNSDPLELARATLYLPTRRACQLMRDIFLDRFNDEAAILPRIVPLGDIDEDEIIFGEAAIPEPAETILSLPPAVAPLERRLLLAQLILQWANSPEVRGVAGSPLIANTPSAALGLADELARLIDDIATRRVSWNRLDKLVPDDLDPFWQLSLRFLKIAREAWPNLLREIGAIEAAERRDRLIESETKRLVGLNAPVIAAGSTGSMPATAKLLETIAMLPYGAVVLPGLDIELDEPSWETISGKDNQNHDSIPAASHAQFAMQALLTRLKISRDRVVQLHAPKAYGREILMSEALRPAATTEHWQLSRKKAGFDAVVETASASMSMIEAANAEEEATAIAVAIREALEEDNKRIALVTSDRTLARRVASALERWQVTVSDSGGETLSQTRAGVFARLTAEAALGGIEPVTLLALLKHPLLRLSGSIGEYDKAIGTLERALFRGPRPRPGSTGLAHAFAAFRANRNTLHTADPCLLIDDDELDSVAGLIARLTTVMAPLETLPHDQYALAALAQCHHQVIEKLSQDADGKAVAFDGHDGTALVRALDELADSPSASCFTVAKKEYPEIFYASIGDRVVRRPETKNADVHIYGLLEARLQMFDRVVLGGLNEGTWPPEPRSDSWLSRPMRRELGLEPPERRIGLAAHDFAQLLGTHEVILSRATKISGAPTVTSRFVQRIAALVGEIHWNAVLSRGNVYINYARALDKPAQIKAIERPAPRPPLVARPRKLSVTSIEDWLRDPYTIYAKYILRLDPLEPVDTAPGARDRGNIIHRVIAEYTKRFAHLAPAEPFKELVVLGEKHFAPLADYPEVRAFWWPRFLRIAQWFGEWDLTRRDRAVALHAEVGGALILPTGKCRFILTGIADRIEQRKDGSYTIIDYKTGTARTEKQIRTGLAPQLTLEAAILHHGAFKDIKPGIVSEITYVTLNGGEPAGKEGVIQFKEGTLDAHAARALTRLAELVAKFDDESTPYLSLVHPMWKTRYGDYDHLARVKEWSGTGGLDVT
jgi:ATP-dependent helicase/nuclease subunit B